AVYRGNHQVGQAERLNRASDSRGLVRVGRGGPAVRHGAVRARARADLAENHERGRPVVPALADVRTLPFLAHRVEAKIAQEAFEARVVGGSVAENPWP